jgi:riboflavin biosynthesis pyrimidine reductase
VQVEFTAFVERKTRKALAAKLPPYITESAVADPPLVAVGNGWSVELFDGPFYVSPPRADRPACSLVFVQSADGNTVADDPSTLGGGETDLHLVYEGLSRVAADAVLAGAGTVRGGQIVFSVWHPAFVDLRQSLALPRHPVQIVATSRGLPMDDLLMFNIPEIPVIVLTTSVGRRIMSRSFGTRPWVRAIEMDGPGGLTEAFRTLRALEIGYVSCVGGRTLANELLESDLVDDIYLTTSPRPGGVSGTPLRFPSNDVTLVERKRGTAEEVGVRFEHFHLNRP